MHKVSLSTFVVVLERRRSSGWQEKKQEASEFFPVTASFRHLLFRKTASKQGSKGLNFSGCFASRTRDGRSTGVPAGGAR